MTTMTLDLMHRCYQTAVEKSKDLIGILNNLRDLLCNCYQDVPEEDLSQFDSFLDGIDSCINIRNKTFDLTNLTEDFYLIMMYIVIWINNSDSNIRVDISIGGRRKSLESDLQKILHKAINNSSTLLRDRFGIRGVINNDESVDTLFKVSNYFVGILANKNRKLRTAFIEWVMNSSKIPPYYKMRIQSILDLPFRVEIVKDYVTNPKPNGYQSLHYIFLLDMDSPYLPGAKLELQMRTKTMDENAKSGSADHLSYKESNIPEEIKKVFTLDSFSKVNMHGFSGYDSPIQDADGIHFSKPLSNRRISDTLVLWNLES